MLIGAGVASANVINPVNAKRVYSWVKRSRRPARKVIKPHKKSAVPTVKRNQRNLNPALAMRKPISYKASSETIPYPKRLSAKKDRIVVSLKKQRAYLMHSKRLMYEFYVSTGKNARGMRTPKGHYRINRYRARSFYSYSEREGAYNAVGWKDGGLYLFHETPFNSHRKLIKSVARDLGKKGSSYGCVHLSVSDSNWFYHHAPTGMRVIIR